MTPHNPKAKATVDVSAEYPFRDLVNSLIAHRKARVIKPNAGPGNPRVELWALIDSMRLVIPEFKAYFERFNFNKLSNRKKLNNELLDCLLMISMLAGVSVTLIKHGRKFTIETDDRYFDSMMGTALNQQRAESLRWILTDRIVKAQSTFKVL